MKIRSEREWRYLAVSCLCFAANAISIWLLPFTVVRDSSAMTGAGYLLGVLFWAALLLGILFFGLAWRVVRQSSAYQEWRKTDGPWIPGFFRTGAARAVDPLWAASLAASILGNVLEGIPDAVTLAAMSLALATFYLHLICNGRVYRYMTQKERTEENSEETEN